MTFFVGPQIGPEPNFHLGPEPNLHLGPEPNFFFKNGPLSSKLAVWILSETTIKIVFSERYTWKKAKQADTKNSDFWHLWKQGVV